MPAARPTWKGHIRLSLVSIPVELYTATKTTEKISFRQIHEPTGKPIHYQKVVAGVGPVDTDEILKGFEYEKGRYVLLSEEDIDAVKLETKKTFDLTQFVGACDIEPLYFDKPYFVSPEEDDASSEAYVVLRDALKETGKVGIGHIVARGHSSLVALRPYHKGLMIETLRYADEVQKADPFYTEVPDSKPDKELLSLAEELIARKTKPFDPKAFSDPYEAALRELIDAKMENRPPESIDEPQIGAKVIDLMEALKKSIGGKEATSTKKAAASAKKPPAKKAPAKAAAKDDAKDTEKKAPAKRKRAA